LISNTDRDSIFPLNGVVDLHAKVRKIYELYGAEKNLGLQITSGPHQDTQELRIHAFRWLNRHLRGDESLIDQVATKLFETKQLKVFAELPKDERVTTIHESFVPKASMEDAPETASELAAATKEWKQQLKSKTFAGWPENAAAPELKVVSNAQRDDANITFAEYSSQAPYRLPLMVLRPTKISNDQKSNPPGPDAPVDVIVLDQSAWEQIASGLAVAAPKRFADTQPNAEVWKRLTSCGRPTVLLAPRGVGPTEWSRDERDRTHIRRRFMLLGQTAAGMQIYDVVRALRALNEHQDRLGIAGPWNLRGSGEAAFVALHASLWSDSIAQLHLTDLPTSNRESPDLLNVSRILDLPQLVTMATGQVPTVVVDGNTKPQWQQRAQSNALLSDLQWGTD
jgi:hypothetical protein